MHDIVKGMMPGVEATEQHFMMSWGLKCIGKVWLMVGVIGFLVERFININTIKKELLK